jgi:hypothetical protein
MELSTRLLIKVSDRCKIAGSCIYPLPIVPDALIKPEFAEPLKPGDKLELDGQMVRSQCDSSSSTTTQAKCRAFIELGPLYNRRRPDRH